MNPTPPRRVLMVAFHFPPQQGSSGILRTMAFARHLPALGWQPTVLTAHPRAYPARDDSAATPPVEVMRAFALDSARHLSIKGRYTRWSALPDRWVTWVLGAVPAGWRTVRRQRPALIWSTYPIASAHLIGLLLHKLTGLPWIADLRDPMTEPAYPRDRLTWRAYRWIEQRMARHCSRMVFTTPGALRTYQARYPDLAPRCVLIENGYDEEHFRDLPAPPPRMPGEPLRLLHSGIIYPLERDPGPLFAALGALRRQGVISPATLRIMLRAPVHDALLRTLAAQHGLEGIVEIGAHLPYQQALAEMLAADGLLLLQAADCNDQIPAKLYEYLRARRPILALTDAAGDTAAAMRAAGLDTVAQLDDATAIAQMLQRFLAMLMEGNAPLPSEAASRAHSRQARSGRLAALFDEVCAEAAATKASPGRR